MEGQRFRDRASDYTAVNARIYGISFDTPDENKAFAEAQSFNYPLLSDVDHAIGKAYGAERPPDDKFPDFARRLTFLIRPDGMIAKIYTVTDVESHPDEVIEDISALS